MDLSHLPDENAYHFAAVLNKKSGNCQIRFHQPHDHRQPPAAGKFSLFK